MNTTFAYAGNKVVGEAISARLEAAGYTRTDDKAAAGTIITYCTSQTELEDVYFDAEGFVQKAAPGTCLIDLSASTPNFARELNAVAVVSDLVAVEAPLVVVDLFVPDAFALRDNLICLVAGESGDVEAVRPLLELIVGAVQPTGPAGSAQLARAAYTIQSVAQITAAIEADALYRAVRHATAGGTAVPPRVGAATPEAERVLAAVNAGRFSGTYTVEMLMAELSAALMAADDADLILPQAEACLHLLELLAVIGGADHAPAALALVYGEEAACAENGLDWTRAEEAYGEAEGECGCDDNCDHDHTYPAGFGYSSN